MLSFHVILAQHSRRSTPLAHALDPLLHFSGRDENLVTETPFSRPLFSSTSALFHFPYPVSPAFATLTKTAGCIPTIPTLERISFRPPAPSPAPYPYLSRAKPRDSLSFHTLAHSFARIKITTLLFSCASALFAQNNRGWGYLPSLPSPRRLAAAGLHLPGRARCARGDDQNSE